jgi:serine/threonine protein kinase
MQEHLSLYLSIFRETLKCFKTIHSHSVTHYDIKCDNILIDFKAGAPKDCPDAFAITVGDFGECHMYVSDKDEFNQRNKGTDHIKSPEMLLLAVAIRKDTDKYDRRKQVGTNSLSDVWGLGCLFYEMLTGDVLFNTEEYAEFHNRLVRNDMTLLTKDKLDKINNNTYLIDFLKYVLVRDKQLRPTIDSVLKRFEHIHALLVATSSSDNSRFNSRNF